MKEKVLVIGAARSGVAVSKLLSLHDYEVTITDMAEIKDKEELIASGMHVFECGHPDHLRNKEWAFVVKNGRQVRGHLPVFLRLLHRAGVEPVW